MCPRACLAGCLLITHPLSCASMRVNACISLDAPSTLAGDFGWGSPQFTKMGRQKVALAQHFLRLGVSELILCDSDAMFLEDPRAFFASYPEADMLSHTDANMPTIRPGDPGLERATAIYSTLNIGLLVLRNTPAMRAFLDKWMNGLVANPKHWDQALFNEIVLQREGLPPLHEYNESQRVVPVWDGHLKVGVLPAAGFSSGHVAFVQHLAPKMQTPQACWGGGVFGVGGCVKWGGWLPKPCDIHGPWCLNNNHPPSFSLLHHRSIWCTRPFSTAGATASARGCARPWSLPTRQSTTPRRGTAPRASCPSSWSGRSCRKTLRTGTTRGTRR